MPPPAAVTGRKSMLLRSCRFVVRISTQSCNRSWLANFTVQHRPRCVPPFNLDTRCRQPLATHTVDKDFPTMAEAEPKRRRSASPATSNPDVLTGLVVNRARCMAMSRANSWPYATVMQNVQKRKRSTSPTSPKASPSWGSPLKDTKTGEPGLKKRSPARSQTAALQQNGSSLSTPSASVAISADGPQSAAPNAEPSVENQIAEVHQTVNEHSRQQSLEHSGDSNPTAAHSMDVDPSKLAQPTLEQPGVQTSGSKAKRKKGQDEPMPLPRQIAECAKRGDAMALVELLGKVQEEGVRLPLTVYNTMLYMLTGQECWDMYVGTTGLAKHLPRPEHNLGQVQPVKLMRGGEHSPEELQQLLGHADAVWELMSKRGAGADEVTYATLARLAAIRGDYMAAMQWAKVSCADGRPLRLRAFAPALMGFAETGNVECALEVEQILVGGGLDMEETSYAMMLEAVRRGGTYQQFTGILERLHNDLNKLTPATAAIIGSFFETPAAAAAFEEGNPLHGKGTAWAMQRVAVAEDGSCEEAGGRLEVMDLEDAEWETFASSVAESAIKQGASQFGNFVSWYDEHGPFDYVVDAANVAFYGQNHTDGGFSWNQVEAMWKHISAASPAKRILMVLHSRRVQDPLAQQPDAARFISQLKADHALYTAPKRANDDWYWLYASVRAGRKGVLVSNDEMRDHLFNLLRPKHFLKWRERHVAHYHVDSTAKITLTPPALFTPCIQHLPSGAWMVPVEGEDLWLCAKPVQ